MGKYQIIYADPPWKYGSKSAVNNSTGNEIKKLSEHYPSMTTEDICDLDVRNITEEDACCFLWFTSSFGEESYKVMRAWGFKPITIINVWEKVTNKGNTCKNVGPWSMGSYEFILYGTKGRMMKYKKATIDQKLVAERFGHSVKPEKAKINIETLFPSLSKIELFAREKSKGWDVWGNEVESDINL